MRDLLAVHILLTAQLSYFIQRPQLPHCKGLHMLWQEENTGPRKSPGRQSIEWLLYLGRGEPHMPYCLDGFPSTFLQGLAQERAASGLLGTAPNANIFSSGVPL